LLRRYTPRNDGKYFTLTLPSPLKGEENIREICKCWNIRVLGRVFLGFKIGVNLS